MTLHHCLVVSIAAFLGAACGSSNAETMSPAPAPVPGVLPAVASPFPAGLTGTLVFMSDLEGRTKIFTLDLAAGRVTRLTDNQAWRDENPRWSPDGRQIVFISNRAHYEGPKPETGDADYDIYVMNPEGSGVRRLTTDPGNERDPFWAPDGKSVVFVSDRDSRGDLYRLWLADGRVERLTHHFVGRAIMPNVSPDGRLVAFAAQSLRIGEFWSFQINVLDLASKGTQGVTQSGGACWPSWSPDGGRLAYVLLDSEPSALEMIDVGSRQKQRLVSDPKLWSYYPDWSPDGRRIAFSVSPEHHEGENWDLALMDVRSPGRFVRLTAGPGNDRLPDWKP